jgi:SAM-dependent MidA family methyltransferase
VPVEKPAAALLAAAVADIEADLGDTFPDGFVSEVSLAVPTWIADIGDCLEQGVAFLFDYGLSRREYYAADRSDGWLRCHFRHHAHNDPYVYPGIQDITAWIDFSAVAGAAVSNDMDIIGYVTQSQFLMAGGLQAEMENFAELPLPKQLELSGQIKTLTLPGEMGENFKCIALGRGEVPTPSAFHHDDRTRTL